MLSEEQIKAVFAKHASCIKEGTNEEVAAVTKQVILELGRLALGLPATDENPAADRATLHIVGKWQSENPDLSFWESFYLRFKDDPVKAIEYLSRQRDQKSTRMAKVRGSEKRNKPKTSLLALHELLEKSPDRDSNDLWHSLRGHISVNQSITRDLSNEIVFNDGERVSRNGFKQRVVRARKSLNNKA